MWKKTFQVFCCAACLLNTVPALADTAAEPIATGEVMKGEVETTIFKTKPPVELGIEHTDHADALLNAFDNLYDTALDKDVEMDKLDKAVTHYRRPSQRAKVRLQDGLNVLVPYKGFSASSEAGDIITNEKSKLNGRSAAEYQRQVLVDQKHLQVTKAVMQLVSGMGDANKEHGDQVVAAGTTKLNELLGEEAVKEFLDTLQNWKADVAVPDTVMAQEIAGPEEQDARHEMALNSALETDELAQHILKEIYKFNHQSTARRTSGRVVETALGVAALAPTIVGPAAALGISVFEVASGGSEEHKLLKELYLSKRLESRKKVLSDELRLAFANYDLALAKHNPLMVAYTELLIIDLCGASTAKKILKQIAKPVATTETKPRRLSKRTHPALL